MPVANSHLFNPSLTGPRKRITQDVDLSVRATFQQNTESWQWGLSAQRPRLRDSATTLRDTKSALRGQHLFCNSNESTP